MSWTGETAFLNCEYKHAAAWMRKARSEAMHHGAIVACLVPSRVDTDWWNRNFMNSDADAGPLLNSRYVPESRVLWLRWAGLLTGIYHHDQRLAFDELDSAPFPSSVVILASPARKLPLPSKGASNWRPNLLQGAPR